MASSGSSSSLHGFAASLQSDTMIGITVGDTQLYVQRSVLLTMSPSFEGTNMFQRLDVRNDSLDAWKTLLYWKIKGEVPSENKYDPKVMFECWLLGDKYQIPDFQNDVMLQLIDYFENESATFEVMKTAFAKSSPNSKLRNLLAEELLSLRDEDDSRDEEIDECNGIPGFASALLNAYDRERRNNWKVFPRLSKSDDKPKHWEEFMVGSGPKQHWVYSMRKKSS